MSSDEATAKNDEGVRLLVARDYAAAYRNLGTFMRGVVARTERLGAP